MVYVQLWQFSDMGMYTSYLRVLELTLPGLYRFCCPHCFESLKSFNFVRAEVESVYDLCPGNIIYLRYDTDSDFTPYVCIMVYDVTPYFIPFKGVT